MTPAPSDTPINQCDGCRRGLPVDESGNHYAWHEGGMRKRLEIGCTKDRYAAVSLPAPHSAHWRTDAIRKLRDERKCFFEQDATMAFAAGTTVFIFPPKLLDD